MEAGRVEIVAGDLEAAEGPLRTAFDRLDAIGDRGYIVTVAPILAEVLIGLGRPDEAEPLLEYTAEWAMADDLDPQIGWRRVKARLLAHRGELEEALRLAGESVEIADGTDYLDDHARALEVLGEVLGLAGRVSESSDARNGRLRSTSRRATRCRSSGCGRCSRASYEPIHSSPCQSACARRRLTATSAQPTAASAAAAVSSGRSVHTTQTRPQTASAAAEANASRRSWLPGIQRGELGHRVSSIVPVGSRWPLPE